MFLLKQIRIVLFISATMHTCTPYVIGTDDVSDIIHLEELPILIKENSRPIVIGVGGGSKFSISIRCFSYS